MPHGVPFSLKNSIIGAVKEKAWKRLHPIWVGDDGPSTRTAGNVRSHLHFFNGVLIFITRDGVITKGWVGGRESEDTYSSFMTCNSYEISPIEIVFIQRLHSLSFGSVISLC